MIPCGYARSVNHDPECHALRRTDLTFQRGFDSFRAHDLFKITKRLANRAQFHCSGNGSESGRFAFCCLMAIFFAKLEVCFPAQRRPESFPPIFRLLTRRVAFPIRVPCAKR